MKVLFNPDTGAEIKDIYKGYPVKFGMGEKWKMEDELADFLIGKFGFLEEIYLSKKDNSDEIPTMEFTPKVSEVPQYSPSDMKVNLPKSIAESDFEGKDSDGVEWVGEGLEDDGGMKIEKRQINQGGRF